MKSESNGDPFAEADAVLKHASELGRGHIAGLGTRAVSRSASPEEMDARIDEPLPEHGADPAGVLDEWLRRAEPGIVGFPGPRYFGFVNGGATPAAVAGDWLGAAL